MAPKKHKKYVLCESCKCEKPTREHISGLQLCTLCEKKKEYKYIYQTTATKDYGLSKNDLEELEYIESIGGIYGQKTKLFSLTDVILLSSKKYKYDPENVNDFLKKRNNEAEKRLVIKQEKIDAQKTKIIQSANGLIQQYENNKIYIKVVLEKHDDPIARDVDVDMIYIPYMLDDIFGYVDCVVDLYKKYAQKIQNIQNVQNVQNIKNIKNVQNKLDIFGTQKRQQEIEFALGLKNMFLRDDSALCSTFINSGLSAVKRIVNVNSVGDIATMMEEASFFYKHVSKKYNYHDKDNAYYDYIENGNELSIVPISILKRFINVYQLNH